MATVLGRSLEQSVRVTNDPIPKIRQAGHQIVGIRAYENADYNVRQDEHLPADEPSTPDGLKKYRKTHVMQPGQIQKHWGVADDASRFPKGYSYGKPSYESEHVGSVIKAQTLEGLADRFNDINEDRYGSHVREPLGNGFSRQYEWPEKTEGGKMNFGVSSQGLDSAKEMIFPQGVYLNETKTQQDLYRKTHGNYQPGEQKKRDYNWKMDPSDHIFGYGEQKVLDGASKALRPERYGDDFPKTVITKKTIEDFKGVSSDLLGQSKNLGQGQDPRPDHVHGIPNVQGDDPWNAARCIHGEPNAREVLPDKDLGKSIKPNCRNVVRAEKDIDRSFGCPTIRKDIPFKNFKSVADYQNYGDEPEAVDLLFPSNFSEIGIEENDFRALRTRTEIRSMFSKIGYEYKIGKFNAMYNRAKEYAETSDDKVSIRHFQMAISEMHSVE